MIRSSLRLCVAVVLAMACVGCMSQAQREFEQADVTAIGLYMTAAQPAVEAYADAAAGTERAAVAEQVRAQTRAMAAQIQADQELRLKRMEVDQQVLTAARLALDWSAEMLTRYGVLPAAASQPAE